MPQPQSQTKKTNRFDNPFDPEISGEQIEKVLEEEPLCRIQTAGFPAHLSLNDILKNDSRFRHFEPGDIIFRLGDYGNSAMLILEGTVQVIRGKNLAPSILGRDKESKKTWWDLLGKSLELLVKTMPFSEVRSPAALDFHQSHSSQEGVLNLKNYEELLQSQPTIQMSAGQMFGEIAALSRSPRNASIIAATEVRCLEIRWQGIRDIRSYDRQFRHHVDQLYRERSLKTHLVQTPLFSELPDDVLEVIIRETSFDSFGEFNWDFIPPDMMDLDPETRLDREPLIVKQGDYINDLILIRAGFARVSQTLNFGHRTTGYLSSGDMFGLNEALFNFRSEAVLPYQNSLRATGFVDIIRVPIPVLERYLFPRLSHIETPYSLKQEDHKDWPLIESGEEAALDGFLDFIVDNRLNNGTASMVIDLNRCTGCDDCLKACANAHQNNPRFIRTGKIFGNYQIVNACMHCVDPICMIGCPTGAIHRNHQGGQVLINDHTCIGCGSCSNNCPYDAIQMVPIRSEKGLYWTAKTHAEPLSKATKCDLCHDQKTGPACEYACPHDALKRINMENFISASGSQS